MVDYCTEGYYRCGTFWTTEEMALKRRRLRHKNWRLKRKLKWVGVDELVFPTKILPHQAAFLEEPWPTEIKGRWADSMSASSVDHSMDCLRYAMDTTNHKTTINKPKRFWRWLYEFLFCWGKR